ncbi:MAG: hypothetical protein GY842_27845 [bacterium]|nr:hypothetical protein [bacterium]
MDEARGDALIQKSLRLGHEKGLARDTKPRSAGSALQARLPTWTDVLAEIGDRDAKYCRTAVFLHKVRRNGNLVLSDTRDGVQREYVHAAIAKCGILTGRSLPERAVIVIRAGGASVRTGVLFDSGQGERSPGGRHPDRGECGQARRGSHFSGVLVQPSEGHGQAASRGGVPVPADVQQVLGAVRDLLVVLPRSPLLRG